MLVLDMIFDVARHKFSEGVMTVVAFAIAAMVISLYGVGSVNEVNMVDVAPLRYIVDDFISRYPYLTAVVLLPIFVYSVLRMARSTVRVGIYSVSSLAMLALGATTMFAVVMAQHYLYLMVVALLISEVLGRLLYCFGPNMRIHYLFTAMLALGVMPLMDSALIPFVILLSALVVIMRSTLRETLITLLGVLLPTFVYCYVEWFFGGGFVDAFVQVWSGVMVSQHAALVAYLTLPRLIFVGVVLFLTLCSILFYYNARVTLTDVARTIWRLLLVVLLLLVASLLVMPSASPALVVVMVLIMTVLLPQFFVRIDVITATIAYVVLMLASVLSLL